MLLVLDDTTVFPVVFLAAMRIGAIPVPVSPLDRADNFRHYVARLLRVARRHGRRPAETVRTALADEGRRYLVRGGGGRRRGRARRRRWPRRTTSSTRPPRTATTWRSGSTARARRASRRASCTCSTTSRSRARATRAKVLGAARGRRHVLDDEALPRLRARQRPDVPAAGSARARSSCAAGRSRSAILATLREHRPTVFFSVPALYGALVRDARPTARWTPCGCASRRPRRCRRRRPSAGRSASASISSTGSGRPRCSTSTARTGPALVVPGRRAPRSRIRAADRRRGGAVSRAGGRRV